MISPITGEVVFDDGLHFGPHEELNESHVRDARSHRLLPIPGWTHHVLGTHPSSFGPCEVEAVSDRDSRIQVVLIALVGPPDSDPSAADLSAHRTEHEAIIAQDLLGQREYSWGEVFCHHDPVLLKEWLVVAYASDSLVPLHPPRMPAYLHEHAAKPHEPEPAFEARRSITPRPPIPDPLPSQVSGEEGTS